jgi:hypothetical protein
MKWKGKKYRIRQIISTFFLILFVLYYINITFFEHTHIINGVTIVHSHFYGKNHTKTPTGGHTETEVTLIAINSLFLSFEDVLTHFDITLFLVLCTIFLVSIHTYYTTGFHNFFFLRAPPAC